jgi:hypothetical protein
MQFPVIPAFVRTSVRRKKSTRHATAGLRTRLDCSRFFVP